MESGPPDGKLTKLPIDPRTMKEASSTDPATWGTFGASLRRVEDGHAVGVGFVLSADDPYVFVDIDGCRNPSTGLLSGLAEDLVERFTSWTEVSPSGTGLHIIIRGSLPEDTRKKNTEHGIECYDRARYFCVTGCTIRDVDITERQAELDSFSAEFLTREKPTRGGGTAAPIPAGVDAQRIIDRMRRSRSASKIISLLGGSTDAHGGDASSADQALCNHLAFWCDRDPRLIDEIFRSSGLMRPKWDDTRKGKTYGEITISRAVEDCSSTYGWETRQRKPNAEPRILSAGTGGDAETGADLVFGAPIETFRNEHRDAPREMLPDEPDRPRIHFQPFPLDCLCPALAEYAAQVAESIGCCPSMVAVPMLSVLGAAIGASRVVEVKPGFTQYAILWTGTLAESGAGKSPALGAAVGPYYRLEELHHNLHTEDCERIRQAHENLPGDGQS
ncbi:MAG: DUF3987 domain-containing protein, partial [Planctomycetaceae bacterium]|nr:DUF3987 domain-containing protein [Planctomycetaceae bacterium]